jgi:hypothetical protein
VGARRRQSVSWNASQQHVRCMSTSPVASRSGECHKLSDDKKYCDSLACFAQSMSRGSMSSVVSASAPNTYRLLHGDACTITGTEGRSESVWGGGQFQAAALGTLQCRLDSTDCPATGQHGQRCNARSQGSPNSPTNQPCLAHPSAEAASIGRERNAFHPAEGPYNTAHEVSAL